MILHIDMDAFYASIEQLDDPRLRGKCVVVGGASNRGVVAAASYEARRFGIYSAMPMFQAREKCSQLVVVPPRRPRYQAVSRQVMAILHAYSPRVEQVSIDEAYLDAEGLERLQGTPENLARTIKAQIRGQTRLTCSIGAAPIKFLSKIASDMDKPDGLTVIPPETMLAVLDRLPVGKIPGVGRRMAAKLKAMGVESLGQVKGYSEIVLQRRLGKSGLRLHQLAQGIDSSRVTPHSPVKSISSEETLGANTRDRKLLARQLLGQAEDVGRQLRHKHLKARTITLKVKYADFSQITRSQTLPRPTQASEFIYREALKLLGGQRLAQAVRLIGVGASNLIAETVLVQQELFPAATAGACDSWEQVAKAVDAVGARFGSQSLQKASLIQTAKPTVDPNNPRRG
ncbi:MAG: DNA polymerase IV [Desulfobacterales bacterium]